MAQIYKIIDNDTHKCYIGSTRQSLKKRLSQHKYDKQTDKYNSSSKLNLNNCSIVCIEECNEDNRFEREAHWINKIECVNEIKMNFNEKEYKKIYTNNHKKEKAEYDKIRRNWFKIFGETKRDINNLLFIKMDLFT